MAIHLKLVLETKEEKENWEKVKEIFGIHSNTETLRALIKRAAKGETT